MTILEYYRLAFGLLVAFHAEFVFAQSFFSVTTTGSIETPSSSTSKEAQTHTVSVGKVGISRPI